MLHKLVNIYDNTDVITSDKIMGGVNYKLDLAEDNDILGGCVAAEIGFKYWNADDDAETLVGKTYQYWIDPDSDRDLGLHWKKIGVFKIDSVTISTASGTADVVGYDKAKYADDIQGILFGGANADIAGLFTNNVNDANRRLVGYNGGPNFFSTLKYNAAGYEAFLADQKLSRRRILSEIATLAHAVVYYDYDGHPVLKDIGLITGYSFDSSVIAHSDSNKVITEATTGVTFYSDIDNTTATTGTSDNMMYIQQGLVTFDNNYYVQRLLSHMTSSSYQGTYRCGKFELLDYPSDLFTNFIDHIGELIWIDSGRIPAGYYQLSSISWSNNIITVESKGNPTWPYKANPYSGEAATPVEKISGLSDYVTQQGTNGAWTYRKWNNGTVEAWASFTTSKNNYTTVNSWYARYDDFTIPSGIFTNFSTAAEMPTIIANVSVGTGITITSNINCTGTNTIRVFSLENQSGVQTCNYKIYAIGE